jgi:predicted methyltransferase
MPYRDTLQEFVRTGGRLEVYISVQTDRTWGDELASDTIQRLGHLGFNLCVDTWLDSG